MRKGCDALMAPTKERGGLTHEGFLGMWRAYLGLKAERDALREVVDAARDYVEGDDPEAWEQLRLRLAALERPE